MIAVMQQSAHSAVATMSANVDRVNGGVTLANQAGAAIQQINEGAVRVVQVVGEISSALAEQSAASNNIAGQVEKVALSTEENAASANQTAAEAENLKHLASSLQQATARFKI